MAGETRVLVVGGINMDLVVTTPRAPQAGETVVGERFFKYPGGKGANQAVACARLGARTFLVGRVGGDSFGEELLQALSASGVDTQGVGRDPEATSGLALIVIEGGGQNRIVQVPGANARCGAPEVERAFRLLPEVDAVLLQLEVPPEVSLEVARRARSRGKVVFLNPAPVKPHPPDLLSLADYLVPNEVEASALTGQAVRDPASALETARTLLGSGARGVVITLGERGACYASPQGEGHIPAVPVPAVDTVGAGDAFAGALAVALCEGKTFPQAVLWANAAGAASVTRHGAQEAMPSRQEVEDLLGRGL